MLTLRAFCFSRRCVFLNLTLFKDLFFFLPALITLLFAVTKQSFIQPSNKFCMVTLKWVQFTLRFQFSLLLLVWNMWSPHKGCKMPLSVDVPDCSTSSFLSRGKTEKGLGLNSLILEQGNNVLRPVQHSFLKTTWPFYSEENRQYVKFF